MIRLTRLPFLLIVFLLAAGLIPQTAFAAQTVAPYASSIKVVNNTVGTADTVTVTDLNVGDVVRVYATPSTTLTIGTGTVPSGTSTAVISISQLGTGSGTIYVSVTSNPNSESPRTSKTYAAEPASPGIDAAQ
ncbi:MAG: Fibronectin type domain protein, partial [Paenibacillus sp.]|nr:Fibronectin type domain protein [Paenibacillus sp.]